MNQIIYNFINHYSDLFYRRNLSPQSIADLSQTKNTGFALLQVVVFPGGSL